MTEWIKRLFHLPGSKLTPEVVLHRTIEKLPRIKGVVVIIQWDDDTFDRDWSAMQMNNLCMASHVFEGQMRHVLVGGTF